MGDTVIDVAEAILATNYHHMQLTMLMKSLMDAGISSFDDV